MKAVTFRRGFAVMQCGEVYHLIDLRKKILEMRANGYPVEVQ